MVVRPTLLLMVPHHPRSSDHNHTTATPGQLIGEYGSGGSGDASAVGRRKQSIGKIKKEEWVRFHLRDPVGAWPPNTRVALALFSAGLREAGRCSAAQDTGVLGVGPGRPSQGRSMLGCLTPGRPRPRPTSARPINAWLPDARPASALVGLYQDSLPWLPAGEASATSLADRPSPLGQRFFFGQPELPKEPSKKLSVKVPERAIDDDTATTVTTADAALFDATNADATAAATTATHADIAANADTAARRRPHAIRNDTYHTSSLLITAGAPDLFVSDIIAQLQLL
ncbi:hypothetical protein KSP39_PZI012519 [Platanthera zijinensis]|uniref:Uncharacterized protein n=1 Tax=Platanthera zijinensis TaxID=2320716 RepID=A0AAP0G4H1_9ASPA